MSCNLCDYAVAKKRIEAEGLVPVLSTRAANFGMGGYNLYQVPPGIDLAHVSDSELKQYSTGYWFMSIPEACCCGDTDFDIPDFWDGAT